MLLNRSQSVSFSSGSESFLVPTWLKVWNTSPFPAREKLVGQCAAEILMFVSQSRIPGAHTLGPLPFLTSFSTRIRIVGLSTGQPRCGATGCKLLFHSKHHNSPSTNLIKYHSDYQATPNSPYSVDSQTKHFFLLKLVVCILLRVLGQVQGFRLTQHWFEYFIQ
jgi:hypothetical protein